MLALWFSLRLDDTRAVHLPAEPLDFGPAIILNDCPDTASPRLNRYADTGEELYRKACATCHGADGKGTPAALLGFDTPLPDFTDCNFATREPDIDWIAVAHQGGPVRGFAPEMPAFGDALTEEELQAILDHIRTLCTDERWPRGELSLPGALVTGKAYPEDEVVLATRTANEGDVSIINEITYGKRFGARNQFELIIPFGFEEEGIGGVLGDVVLGAKRVLFHRLSAGSIVSIGGEIVLPTGHKDHRVVNFSTGMTQVESFVAYGQGLAADAFLQFQSGTVLSAYPEQAVSQIFLRGALGKTITQGRWGRAWTPMVEVLGTQYPDEAADWHLEFVPQVQVTLNQRQHVMLLVGARVPANEPTRNARLAVHLLWEWYDGGFFEGW